MGRDVSERIVEKEDRMRRENKEEEGWREKRELRV